MSDVQSLTALLIFVLALAFCIIRANADEAARNRKAELPPTDPELKPKSQTVKPIPPQPREHSPRLKALKQNLLAKVLYDEAKAARLFQFEVEEVKRKGLPLESSEAILERAIERLERDNR
jgi:FtsZ-binding cell division protein ZapB